MFKKSMMAVLAFGLGVGLFIGCGGGGTTAPEESATSCKTLPKTGQTVSYALHDDGDYQKGLDRNFTRGEGGVAIVIDHITGLMWEDYNHVSSTEVTWMEAIDYCKDLTFGTYSDWRVPTLEELYLFADKERVNPSLDSASIYYWKSDFYWTSTPYTRLSKNAYIVRFDNAVSTRSPQIVSWWVRCVRGEQQKTEFTRDEVKDIVLDKTYCLMWQDDESVETKAEMKWNDAIEYCESLTFGDYVGWRLPNINELRLANLNAPFKYKDSQTFWSSTTYPLDTDSARVVIDYGYESREYFEDKDSSYSVRCIRDGS